MGDKTRSTRNIVFNGDSVCRTFSKLHPWGQDQKRQRAGSAANIANAIVRAIVRRAFRCQCEASGLCWPPIFTGVDERQIGDAIAYLPVRPAFVTASIDSYIPP